MLTFFLESNSFLLIFSSLYEYVGKPGEDVVIERFTCRHIPSFHKRVARQDTSLKGKPVNEIVLNSLHVQRAPACHSRKQNDFSDYVSEIKVNFKCENTCLFLILK